MAGRPDRMARMPDQPPLSLYVHLPWCVRKCPYCDFNSHKAGDAPPRARYVDALLADLRREKACGRDAGRTIDTVFIGGGTPSLFSAAEIATVLQAIDDSFPLASDAEITMEANPGTIERGDPLGYRRAGVNRLSLGAQSFDAGILQALGRIHGPDEIVAAFEGAVAAGFDNINIDLMFALPGQDLAAAKRDIKQAIALAPQHISYYQLTLEPNTVFARRPPIDLPDAENSWDIQEAGQQLLVDAGYRQYEVSAFAQQHRRCRHNLNYWQFGDYLAIGAGAHGKYTDMSGAVWRYWKPLHPLSYIEAAEAGALDDNQRKQSPADVSFEFMLNHLRLSQGFTPALFEQRTGQSIDRIRAPLERARADGLLRQVGMEWQVTEFGQRFLNDLQARFLLEDMVADG